MTSGALHPDEVFVPRAGLTHADILLVGLALLALYVPTYLKHNDSIWQIVGQGHGPIILALTIWLIWQRIPALMASDGRPATVAGWFSLALGGLMYAVGHSQDMLVFDVGSHMPVLLGIVLLYRGWPGAKIMWFPIFFIFFMVPVPGSIVDQITSPLKAGVSYVAEGLVYAMGYPIGRSGVTLTIGPYVLLVADACAGLNSIFALEAVGIFYMSLCNHTSKARNLLLAVLILPISFVSNVIRVMALVLVTYYFGDDVGRGFVHDFAGIFLFTLAAVLTIATDTFLGLFFKNEPATLAPEAPLKAA